MDSEENLTEETQVDESQLNSATGEEAVSTPEAFTLEELNSITGKQFKSKESALKSIQDMSKMAGKAADLMGKTKDAEDVRARLESAEQEVFLARNPQHEANLELLQTLAKASGVSLKEATQLPVYLNVLEKTKMAEESVSKRTIASSNNRVARPVEDDMSKVIGDPLKSAEYVVKQFMS
jgi:hypothetical protein